MAAPSPNGMALPDLPSLASVLAATYGMDGRARGEAEKSLAALEAIPGSHGLYLQLITAASDPAAAQYLPIQVQQAAALRLKNLYRGFRASVREGPGAAITDADRASMRTHILEAIVRQTSPLLRVQLLEVVRNLWPTEAPNEWAQLIPDILRNVQQGMSAQPPQMLRVYGSICTLRMVMKRYEFKEPDSRGPMYDIADATFPTLLSVYQTIAAIQPPTHETLEMCRILTKIFYVATSIAIPPSMLRDFNRVAPWLDVVAALLEFPAGGPEQFGTAEQLAAMDPIELDEKVSKSAAWKVKKWTGQTFLRLMNRFGREEHVGVTPDKKVKGAKKKKLMEDAALKKAWAKEFEARYGLRALTAFMNLLQARVNGRYVSERVMFQAFMYIDVCSGCARYYKLLKPHLPFLIQQSILGQLRPRPSDLALWQSDPQEYIRRSLDLMSEFQDPKLAATSLLFELVQMRTRDTLQLTLNTITQVCEAYENAPAGSKDFLSKEAALRMFGSLKRLLLSKNEFKDGIENILIRHVLPEFSSQHGFLRAAACWTVRKYYKLQWKNEEAHANAVRLCINCLRDTDLPVRLSAWEATAYIIEHDKVFEYIRPSLPLIIEQFYTLFDEIGNEKVAEVLSELVTKFDSDVIPYAADLVRKLSQLYVQYMLASVGDGTPEHPGNEDDDDDEAGGAALQTLRALVAVFEAIKSKPEVFTALRPFCHEVIQRSMNDRCIEYYDDILDLIDVITYNSPEGIPADMWQYLVPMCQSFHDFAGDFAGQLLSPIDNYLSRGNQQLATAEGQPLLQAIISIPQAILSDQERLIDAPQACILLECMIANLRGHIDSFIPGIVDLAATRLLAIVHMEEERERKRREKAAKAAAKAKKGGIKKKGKMVFKSAEEEEEENEEDEMLALKFSLLDVIGLCAHYNPQLFMQLLASRPLDVSGKLFNTWLSYVKTMKDDYDCAKNAVLGFSAILTMPPSAVPMPFRNALPDILNELLAILKEMSTLLEEAANAEEEEEENVEDERHVAFHDIGEDEDVYTKEDGNDNDNEEGEIELDDAAEEGDEDAELMLDEFDAAWLAAEEDNLRRFASPLDDVDPFIFFMQALETLSRHDNSFYQQWLQSIGSQGQPLLQQHAEQAKQHALDMEKEKQKKKEEEEQQQNGQRNA